jgi:cardiolipin synthase
VLAFTSDNGVSAAAAIIYAIVGWSDYADGIAARVTGQYSRFGALLDPVVDRLLVISGVVVVWHFDLLPRVGLALLVAREVLLLVGGRYALQRGVALKINWYGRIAVWPVMSAVFFALVGLDGAAAVLLWVGLALSYAAAIEYAATARRELRASRPAPSSRA